MKLAQRKESMSPVDFASELERFDVSAGIDRMWDRYIPDAWYSTFNMSKTAAGISKAQATIRFGSEQVTEHALINLGKTPKDLMTHFGEGFAKDFIKDPVSMFSSMPMPQKKIIARMAEDTVGNY
jgi:hypothetical protein